MAILVINNAILKYVQSTAQPIDNNLVPLTIFDKAALDVHIASIYPFKPPMPSNEILKKSLSKVLNHYPHLCGRLTVDEEGHKCIVLNNAGVRIIETFVSTTLAHHLTLDPSKEVSHLHPPLQGIDELLQIQLNRYSCGGLVLGLTAHHRVADGQSMSNFLVAWTRVVRGLDVDPLPYHDRAAISVPRDQPRVEFDHRWNEFKQNNLPDTPGLFSPIEKLVTNFSAEFIQKLKAKVIQENITPNQRYSSFECLLAHVWKKVTQARGLKPEQFTQIRVAVNGRSRMTPPVPMEYFGNLVLWAYPKLTVKKVVTESHAYVVKAIHNAISNIDNKYFKSFVDFGEISKKSGKEFAATVPENGNIMCPDLEVDSWLRLNFQDIDFGGGPCAFCRPNIPIEGVMVFMQSSKGQGGGVDLVMSLMPEHARIFKQISHSLLPTTNLKQCF